VPAILVAASAGCTDDDALSPALGSGAAGGAGGFDATGGGSSSGVPQTCDQAREQQSYIGCEYWPTITSNARLYPGFDFAVVAANPTGSPANIAVMRGGNVVDTTSVDPGELVTIRLPWIVELKQEETQADAKDITSALVPDGAYQLVSSVPITLYQFNPLEFQLDTVPADCPNGSMFGACYSFTNDASLLLPSSALRSEYYALARPTQHLGQENLVFMTTAWVNRPGFVAVTATQDDTEVTFESSAHVRPGGGVGALAPGESASYQLDAGDVLMVQSGVLPDGPTAVAGMPCEVETNGNYDMHKCPTPADYDLSGSHIVASKPVSVIGGHDCSFVPYNQYACDHLEESLLPVEALGRELFVTAPQAAWAIDSAPGTPESMYVRVLSAVDGNSVQFEPAVQPPVTLDAGQWIEIGPVSEDFRVLADDKVLVAQFMVGQDFSGMGAETGDPSMSLAIPVEQYRLSYGLLAPASYTYNYVNVVAPTGTAVQVDGQAIDAGEWKAIGSSGMSVARHQIGGGPHRIEGNANFGVVVYGYGAYTSYMYPGGLNLETVVIDPR
jgi:hypothetical protein